MPVARRSFRRWARNEVNLPVRLEILTGDGRKFTTGTALLRDVSLRGARLGRIVLRKPCLPARPFRLRLRFEGAKYQGVGAVCRPVRFGPGPEFELAVEFEDFWASADGSSRSAVPEAKRKRR
jgi:hypothetical protein